MIIDQLNAKFGVAGAISFFAGPSGFTNLKLQHRSGSAVTMSLYGAHILSWSTPVHGERLFLSNKAIFTPGKAIRGGIPIIFPQFGPGKLPSHGFGRTREWGISAAKVESNGVVFVTLSLEDSDDTRKLWAYSFRIELEVSLGAELTTSVRIENRDTGAFSCQLAFHTYFSITDISKVSIPGFGGLRYSDNLRENSVHTETNSEIKFSGELDRVYMNAPNKIFINQGESRIVQIEKVGLPDAVVWNPWIEKTKGLSDLSPNDFRKFVCVETGAISEPVVINPGKQFESSQRLS